MIEINSVSDVSKAMDGHEDHASPAPAFAITVRYIRAQSSGDAVWIGVELCDKERNLSESRRYRVQTALLASLNVRRGPISEQTLIEIEQAATLSAAWQRALSILAYGANSSRSLSLKLRQRGFDAEVTERAVELVRAQGYLHEDGDALREAERSLAKGWGLRRIGQHLRQRGYATEAVDAALESLSNEDFYERCCCAARKYHRVPPTDANQKQKIVAYLLRYGYDMSEIRHALDSAWEDADA